MSQLRVATLLLVALAVLVPLVPAGAVSAPGDGWYRVGYAERIAAEDRAALEALGADAVQYSHPDGYVAWMGADAAQVLAGSGQVTEVRRIEAAEKLDDRLAGERAVARAEVIVHRTTAASTRAMLAGLGEVHDTSPAAIDGSLVSHVAEVPVGALGRIAAHPAVLHVALASEGLEPEGERSAQVVAGNLDPSGRTITGPGYPAWLDAHGLDGEGVTVSIVDTGVDDGHPDLSGRMAGRFAYSRLPTGDPWDSGGHGTHVAGIAVGAAGGLPGVGTPTDDAGFLYGHGIAPGATYIDQPAISRTREGLPPPGGFPRISGDAVRAGAVAWNASWTDGGGERAGYVNNARVMDQIVRDADWDTPESDPFTLVFSAGNSGQDGVTAPKEAKNIITVASSQSPYVEGGRPYRISSWSSRGPAHDGRVVPTITAPGETVAAARSRLPAESCNVIDTGSLWLLPTDGYGMHAFCSGTSMAAPQVTGAVALVHQWWRRDFEGTDPSPAMVKALLVNSATPLGSEIPNDDEGWGRINLGTLFDPDADRLYLDQGVVLTRPGEVHSVDVDVADPSEPLRVSLVWTDAAAHWGADVALVNDLDLQVAAADGTAYLGNAFDGQFTIAGGEPDRINNVENVYLRGATGSYRITVTAENLPGEGVPGAGRTSQDFALVISNATAG